MEEKELNKKLAEDTNKLEWEAPKLFCLDKGKTYGGSTFAEIESGSYGPTPPS